MLSPAAFRSSWLAEISAGPLFFVPSSRGLLLSHMLLLRLLPPPFSSPSSLQCTHLTPLQTHGPIVFLSSLPWPSGFQMRPAEPAPSSTGPTLTALGKEPGGVCQAFPSSFTSLVPSRLLLPILLPEIPSSSSAAPSPHPVFSPGPGPPLLSLELPLPSPLPHRSSGV